MAGRGSSWAEPAANVIKLFSFVLEDLAKKAKVISRESILSNLIRLAGLARLVCLLGQEKLGMLVRLAKLKTWQGRLAW
jgi:hypothetical protein